MPNLTSFLAAASWDSGHQKSRVDRNPVSTDRWIHVGFTATQKYWKKELNYNRFPKNKRRNIFQHHFCQNFKDTRDFYSGLRFSVSVNKKRFITARDTAPGVLQILFKNPRARLSKASVRLCFWCLPSCWRTRGSWWNPAMTLQLYCTSRTRRRTIFHKTQKHLPCFYYSDPDQF